MQLLRLLLLPYVQPSLLASSRCTFCCSCTQLLLLLLPLLLLLLRSGLGQRCVDGALHECLCADCCQLLSCCQVSSILLHHPVIWRKGLEGGGGQVQEERSSNQPL